MASPARDSELSYEDYFRSNAVQFTAFLRKTLGRQAEDVGGRVAAADTLQEAMIVALGRWSELQRADPQERDRRVYRCLRDAAGEALRREHGRLQEGHGRPHVIAYDFGLLHERDREAMSARERELTTAVLGAMAAAVAAAGASGERRGLLDRAVLLAGLRALSEREAVVLIAVDHLGWDQEELARRLDLESVALRTVLFEARRVFYGVVRHAAGIELDEEERGRLHAYQSGELAGRERRVARRHLQHCEACQALVREMGRFGGQAQRLLAPMPFVFGVGALSRRAPVKAAPAGAAVALGLFGQAGAAKALTVTVALLSVGVGVSGWLAEKHAPRQHGPELEISALGAATSLGTVPASRPGLQTPTASRHRTSHPAKRKRTQRQQAPAKRRPSATFFEPGPTASQQTPVQPATPVTPAAPSRSQSPSSATSSGGSAGASKSSGQGGSEFFDG